MIFFLGFYFKDFQKIYLALTNIYGIGVSTSKQILLKLNIHKNTKVYQLSKNQFIEIFTYINKKRYKIENNLLKFTQTHINSLIYIKCYRGKRFLRALPTRGQRTRTNSRTCRILARSMYV